MNRPTEGKPLGTGRLLLLGATVATVMSALVAVGLLALAKLSGHSPVAVAGQVLKSLSAGSAVASLEQRVTALEHAVAALAPPAAALAPPDSSSPASTARLAAASQPPPMTAAPTPAFPDAAKVAEVDFAPSVAAPTFRGRELRVCAEKRCRFKTFVDALEAAKDGDTIRLAPGLYGECANKIKPSIAVIGDIAPDGTRATFNTACAGKGAFNFSSSQFLLEGVQIQDIAVSDNNGACVRLQPRAQTSQVAHLRNVICLRSENGVMGGVGPEGALIVEGSLLIGNGKDGRAHGIYVNKGREVILRDSIVHSTQGSGHSVKVGAHRFIVESSIVAALNGQNSRGIDYYGGGVLRVVDSVLQQGPNSSNHDIIGLAQEGRRLNLGVPHAAYVSDSWFIYDDPDRCCRWLLSGRETGEVVLENNTFVAINGSRLKAFEDRDNRRFDSREAAGLPAYAPALSALPRPAAWDEG
ncbi:MAG: right-handed parallel beta-helix repeat-containing protein [Pseudomonadota bacterium]